MLKIETYKGNLTPYYLIKDDGSKIYFCHQRGLTYNYGEVYASFEVCGKTYILLQTVPVNQNQTFPE